VRTTWILIGVVQSGKGAISEVAEILRSNTVNATMIN
jgi:hypothetical protein